MACAGCGKITVVDTADGRLESPWMRMKIQLDAERQTREDYVVEASHSEAVIYLCSTFCSDAGLLNTVADIPMGGFWATRVYREDSMKREESDER